MIVCNVLYKEMEKVQHFTALSAFQLHFSPRNQCFVIIQNTEICTDLFFYYFNSRQNTFIRQSAVSNLKQHSQSHVNLSLSHYQVPSQHDAAGCVEVTGSESQSGAVFGMHWSQRLSCGFMPGSQ